MAELNSLYGGTLTVPQSPLSEVGDLPEGTTQETSPVIRVSMLPESTVLPNSPENHIASPSATILPVSSIHPVSSFGAALHQPGFPAYLVPPKTPGFSVLSAVSALQCKVVSSGGNRFRLCNNTTGAATGWFDSGSSISVSIQSNVWNLIHVEFETGPQTQIANFDINTSHKAASFVLHYLGAAPTFGYVGGWASNAMLLDVQVDSAFGPAYFDISSRNVSAEVIDRILIAADSNGRNTGTMNFQSNPGSNDSLRSTAGYAALFNLLFKGWTLTR